MKTKGFTLIELMIVVAIIAIIAAIAIPNLLRSRLAANESSAIGSLRTLTSAQAAFQQSGLSTAANGLGQYASTLTQLGPAGLGTPPFIDGALAGANTDPKSGYTFQIDPPSQPGATFADGFEATAEPSVPDRTGVRRFFVDESGVITFNTGGPAGSTDNPIQ